jgi:hypothetical protein
VWWWHIAHVCSGSIRFKLRSDVRYVVRHAVLDGHVGDGRYQRVRRRRPAPGKYYGPVARSAGRSGYTDSTRRRFPTGVDATATAGCPAVRSLTAPVYLVAVPCGAPQRYLTSPTDDAARVSTVLFVRPPRFPGVSPRLPASPPRPRSLDSSPITAAHRTPEVRR